MDATLRTVATVFIIQSCSHINYDKRILTVCSGPPLWGLYDQSTVILLVGLLVEVKVQDNVTVSPLDACSSAGVFTVMEKTKEGAGGKMVERRSRKRMRMTQESRKREM